MLILTTGGAGFIGSHTILELLNAGHNVISVDNGCNAYVDGVGALPESLRRVQELTGKTVINYAVDIREKHELDVVFKKHKIDCVVHFAALKSVGESCRVPMQYYQNNITGTAILLETMTENGVFNLVYSSSATVYGDPQFLPLTEDHPTGNCTNPYGKSKYFTEEMMKDLCASDMRWKVISLRYFNPVGAHVSGRIGEDPNGEPNNLMPYITQVAVGKLKMLRVFGNDYPTHDGTGVRDYCHIYDIAMGHISALEKLGAGGVEGFVVYNLGTGSGYSVLDIVKAFSKACGQDIPYEIVARRDGDIAECYASTVKAEKELGWKAEKGLSEICDDAWRWQKNNPQGFAGSKM